MYVWLCYTFPLKFFIYIIILTIFWQRFKEILLINYYTGFNRISSSNDKNSFLDNLIDSKCFYKSNISLFLFRVKLYSKFFLYIIA